MKKEVIIIQKEGIESLKKVILALKLQVKQLEHQKNKLIGENLALKNKLMDSEK
jgi:hypothetical protein